MTPDILNMTFEERCDHPKMMLCLDFDGVIHHKLSMKEVEEHFGSKKKVGRAVIRTRFREAKWKANLAGVVADNFGCYTLIIGGRSHDVVFVGMEDNLTVCKIVYQYAYDFVLKQATVLKKEYVKQGMSVRGLENNYAMGFIVGLNKQFQEQVQTDSSVALIVQKDPDVDAFVERLNISERVYDSSVKPDRSYTDAILKGHRDGLTFDISRKIGPGQEAEGVLP